MSDLQCPARFLVLSSPDGSDADALRHERVAAVYDGPSGRDDDGLALALGLPVRAMGHRLSVQEVLQRDARALTALRDLADLHRGETVVVLAEGRPGQRVDVAVDGDGISVEPVSPEAWR